MKRIVYIGMDVHSTNFTFCSLEPKLGGENKFFGCMQSEADVKNVLKYIEGLKKELGDDVEFLCGYEAGCLGFSLYQQLKKQGVECVILAPSTMMASKGKRIKTDARDAKRIAQCLAYGTYSSVHIPSSDDDAVKEYIRMRDDHKIALKKLKQQINALCLRNGRQYTGTKWTLTHLRWLRDMDWQEAVLKETLQEYLMTFEQMTNKLEALDRRIEELAQGEKYKERVKGEKAGLPPWSEDENSSGKYCGSWRFLSVREGQHLRRVSWADARRKLQWRYRTPGRAQQGRERTPSYLVYRGSTRDLQREDWT